MSLLNFLSLFVLILVQSSNSQQFENETLRSSTYFWTPYVCSADEFDKLKLQYLVPVKDKLFFYFQDHVLRIKEVQTVFNSLRRRDEHDRENYFLTYGDPEIANYSEMQSKPNLLTSGQVKAFFHIKKDNQEWKTYSLIDNKANEVILP